MTTELSDLVRPDVQSIASYIKKRYPYDILSLRLAQIDPVLVRQIINSGFRETGDILVNDYFTGKENAQFFMIDKKGVAVMIGDYLDILAVAEKYQHNGVGPALLGRVIEETHGRFYLRSRPDRPVNRTYERFADPIPFTSKDGIDYNGYLSGHTLPETEQRMRLMQEKPSNFNPRTACNPKHLLTPSFYFFF